MAKATVDVIDTGTWSLLGVARNLVALLTEGIRILASSLGGLVKGQGQSGGILVFDGGTSQVIIRLRTQQWRKREDGAKKKRGTTRVHLKRECASEDHLAQVEHVTL